MAIGFSAGQEEPQIKQQALTLQLGSELVSSGLLSNLVTWENNSGYPTAAPKRDNFVQQPEVRLRCNLQSPFHLFDVNNKGRDCGVSAS